MTACGEDRWSLAGLVTTCGEDRWGLAGLVAACGEDRWSLVVGFICALLHTIAAELMQTKSRRLLGGGGHWSHWSAGWGFNRAAVTGHTGQQEEFRP